MISSDSCSLPLVPSALNPSLHNARGMVLDEGSIPVHEYIVGRLNDYDLPYLHLTEPFTPVADIPYAVTEVATHFRLLYMGTLIFNKGFNGETGNKVIADQRSAGCLFLVILKMTLAVGLADKGTPSNWVILTPPSFSTAFWER